MTPAPKSQPTHPYDLDGHVRDALNLLREAQLQANEQDDHNRYNDLGAGFRALAATFLPTWEDAHRLYDLVGDNGEDVSYNLALLRREREDDEAQRLADEEDAFTDWIAGHGETCLRRTERGSSSATVALVHAGLLVAAALVLSPFVDVLAAAGQVL